MTTVHLRDDSRIRSKQARTLAEQTGEEVSIYVQDGLGFEVDDANSCTIVDTGPRTARLVRMTKGAWKMIRAVKKAQPKLVFFHDPELIPWAFLLQMTGIKVIYDVHENYAGQIRRSPRLPRLLRPILAPVTSLMEIVFAQFFSGIIAVDPEIASRFPKRKTVVVRNSPLIEELTPLTTVPMAERPKEFAYVGTINEDRNIFSMIDCVDQLGIDEACLRLAGDFVTSELEDRVRATESWKSVKFDGWVSREGVRDLLADARAGLLLIKPIKHEMTSMPIKMCEYMAAGVPIIASDFPVWREIIIGAGAGLVVDPTDNNAIISALQYILDNPQEAEAMGKRGRKAVLEKYNWGAESKEMMRLYNQIVGQATSAE